MSIRLNLGSGRDAFPGWIGVDNQRRNTPDILHDLRDLPLPFLTDSVAFIFMEMTLSQIELWQGRNLLKDCHRVLRIDGSIRIHEADFDWLLAVYADGVPEEEVGTSRAEAFQRRCRSTGWTFLYDEKTLRAALTEAGFANVRKMPNGTSSIEEFRRMEKRRGGIVIEGDKTNA